MPGSGRTLGTVTRQPRAGDAEGSEPAPALTVAAVARRLGVAPATLRTWDRRYGLGPTEHTAGAHRRYTSADLARLSVMRRLSVEGVAPAEAARVATGTDVARPSPVLRSPGTGGRVVALPDGTPAARGLARAAMALDSAACTELVRASLHTGGLVATWEQLVVPVLVGVGRRWALTGEGVDVEHLLSECVLACLRSEFPPPAEPLNGRPVLLACAEEDQHSLPLHALAAALAELGVSTRLLGARVPHESLVAAVRRSGPAAVFVWASLPRHGADRQPPALPALRPAPAVVVGGPGWPEELLADVRRAADLPSAAAAVVASCGL